MKKAAFFILAVVISYFAATWKVGDSAHSIGVIKAEGGGAKHPSQMTTGEDGYTFIATATVLPPYQGDATVKLEGSPELPYEILMSGPVIDLGIRRHPTFKNGVLYGLKPMDKVALWVLIDTPKIDPVCGMSCKDAITQQYNGKNYFFCSEPCLDAFKAAPENYKDKDGIKGEYNLVFYDTKTGAAVMKAPLVFKGKGEMRDGSRQHH